MKKTLTLFAVVLFIFGFGGMQTMNAQEEAKKEEAPKVEEGWKIGAGLGLDFAQLLQINPKQGAGQNRVGFGGGLNFFANYKKGRAAWDNVALWQFGVQRLGAGVIAQGAGESKIPFQKSIDELRLNSKYGYAIKEGGKLFAAADFSFLSQLAATYQGTDTYPGNFLSDITNTNASPIAKFFSPATMTLSVGLDYKPKDNLSFYFSPLAAKWIIVNDDNIAALNVHGNPEGENVFSALGALARMNYSTKMLNDKVVYTTNLALFSNYKLEPQNIDVDWANDIGFEIVKGLTANILLNVFYDHDIKVQVTDYDKLNGVDGLGRRASITEQFLMKYTKTF